MLIQSTFTGIFLSTPENYQLTYNPAIWFLTCLFLVELLFFFYYRLSRGKWIGLFLLTAAILGYGSTFLQFAIPWNGFVALTAVVFLWSWIFNEIVLENALLENRRSISIQFL